MSDFFCKLIGPRPTFTSDMTPDERAIMIQHGAYWKQGLQRGNVVVFGLVADPSEPFGMGVVRFDTEAEARSFCDGDPTIQSKRGFRIDMYPMPMGAVNT